MQIFVDKPHFSCSELSIQWYYLVLMLQVWSYCPLLDVNLVDDIKSINFGPKKAYIVSSSCSSNNSGEETNLHFLIHQISGKKIVLLVQTFLKD